jgi:peptidyl-prolyl cis-trans isomerase B (cyclophilin B)
MMRATGRLALLAGLLLLAACGNTTQTQKDGGAPNLAAGQPGAAAEPAPAPPSQQETTVSKRYLMDTSFGKITLELDSTKAPKTVANFDAYVRKGHYDGTIFHRVIDNFMIQGGGFDAQMTQRSTDPPIENEAANGLKNQRYTIAMARTSAVHSATAQFFINVKDNDFLDFRSADPQGFGYCVFGQVTEGTEVVDRIKGVATGSAGGMRDVPVEPVTILSVAPID